MSLVSQIPQTITSCNEIHNTGTEILFHALPSGTTSPTATTIVATANILVGSSTADIRLQDAGFSPQSLSAGSVLYFLIPDQTIVLAEDISLTNVSQTVNIENTVTTQIDNGDVCTFYPNTYKLLAPSNIPLNITPDVTDRTDFTSIQGGSLKSRVNVDFSVQAIATLSDRALWDIVYPSAMSNNNVYVAINDPSTQFTFGMGRIDDYSEDGSTEEIKRPNFNLKLLHHHYTLYAPFSFLSASDKIVVNDTRSLFLLPRY